MKIIMALIPQSGSRTSLKFDRPLLSRCLGALLLQAAFGASVARADQLTMFFYPSPLGIDWSGPQSLVRSTLHNMLYRDQEASANHPIGHVNFDLECSPSAELAKGARIVTGQTSDDGYESFDKALRQGYGLQLVLDSTLGRWEKRESIEKDLPIFYRRGEVSFIEFKIRPRTCARAARYLAEYRRLGYDKIYGGLPHRPRWREGGGCIAFALSVMDVAGLMAPEWNSYWRHSVNIPLRLLGGPKNGRFVQVGDVLFNPLYARWAQPWERARPLTFWDPFYAHYWILEANRRPVQLTGMSYRPANRENARGIAIDARSRPTPTEPFWMN